MKVGWVSASDAIGGTKATIDNLKKCVPSDIEIIDYDEEKPSQADVYVVHTLRIPQNLPIFPKLGPITRKRPVIFYGHSWRVDVLGADIIVYQSPAHLANKETGAKGILLAPPILEYEYEKKDVEREHENLWVGNFGEPTNGADVAIRKAESEKVKLDFYGWGIPPGTGDTNCCSFRQVVDHEGMAELYQKYKTLRYYPRRPVPFGRAVAEALLNGCEINAWGKLGILSFDSLDAALDACKQSGEAFWTMVKEEAS